MARVRVSTTVDQELLAEARRICVDLRDAALLDAALNALIARRRSAEIDEAYAAYDEHPLDEPDEWGDLASFHQAARSSRAPIRSMARSGGANSQRSLVALWLCSLGAPPSLDAVERWWHRARRLFVAYPAK